MPIRRLDKTLTATTATIAGEDIAASSIPVKPHIQPGVLQPAVAGKLLDGTTSHGATYGVAQSDGRMYYYTDIKGSKPIKDPRIGAHFGSQRHKFQSLQLLEQETATHGDKVFSIDGREWCRAVGGNWVTHNGPYGVGLEQSGSGGATDTQYIEIVGYFNDVNVLHYLAWVGSHDMHRVYINGGTVQSTDLSVTSSTPLGGRYVQAHSLINLAFNSTPTLGINTLKIANTTGHYLVAGGIELIAQDTTSTANKSKIQIPAQNVVSYGKKFAIPATAQHYNPFAFKTDGSTAWASGAHNGTAWPVGTGSSANIDTATSLGLEAWVSTNYYKPYNGGRVVWWVDSSGTLKCSVNMMPPNARSIANSASLTNGGEKGDDSAGTSSAAVANNTFYPTFTDQAIDHSQAEVAKTYHWREFGNGAVNSHGGGGTSNTYADASMLSVTDNIAYVMDDGLTSFSGSGVKNNGGPLLPNATDDHYFITFIGTGIGYIEDVTQKKSATIAQNLPYGTHILQVLRDADTTPDLTLDGVAINDVSGSLPTTGEINQITFHQPKMPPIPEDAVVISDYMLMADFLAVGAGGFNNISKGSRKISLSRDGFFNSSASISNTELSPTFSYGIVAASSGSAEMTVRLPAFASEITMQGECNTTSATSAKNSWGGNAITLAQQSGGTSIQENLIYSSGTKPTLGINNFQHLTTAGGHRTNAFDIATPIHTSSHYQTFETPFLDELVGGDRNMEQNNLVVTSDGKTWDQVTRDVSYLGTQIYRWGFTNAHLAVSEVHGTAGSELLLRGEHWRVNYGGKNFTPAYDRHICLRDGLYRIFARSYYPIDSSNGAYAVKVNGLTIGIYAYVSASNSQEDIAGNSFVQPLKRGDYVQIYGGHIANVSNAQDFYIERLGDYRNVY